MVSRRVLAYIAPVLREATQVDGRVSARVAKLSVPLAGPSPEQGGPQVDLAAKVAFQQVTYGPGPMMQNILGMTGMAPQQVPQSEGSRAAARALRSVPWVVPRPVISTTE